MFKPCVQQAINALALCDFENWPDELPTPSVAEFNMACEVYQTQGEGRAFAALDLSPMDWLDLSQGNQGWALRGAGAARYKVVIVDEAGVLGAHHLHTLRGMCDTLILLGDQARQLQPIITDAARDAAADVSQLYSAMGPKVLESVGAQRLVLKHNMRGGSVIQRASDIIFEPLPNGQLRSFHQVLEAILEECGPTIVSSAFVPLEEVRAGSPLFVFRNIPRMNLALWARQAMGVPTDDAPLQVGEPLTVAWVRPAMRAQMPNVMVKNSRWIVTGTHPSGRVDLVFVGDRRVTVSRVALGVREYEGGDTQKWKALHGEPYPVIGMRDPDVIAVFGTCLTAERGMGDTVDTSMVLVSEFRELARLGFKDDEDGLETWRRKLNVAITRARNKVVLCFGHEFKESGA
jgi:hypothetical protein